MSRYQLPLIAILLILTGCTPPAVTARSATKATTAPTLVKPRGDQNNRTPAPVVVSPVSLAGSASIIGKLKSAPASLIANSDVGLLSDHGTGIVSNNGGSALGGGVSNTPMTLLNAYRLLTLTESPRAGAKVRLVDAAGRPLTEEVATTDDAGAFTLHVPAGLAPALVQATFDADGKPIEYLAPAPATGSLEVDTASTLATARWRLDLAAGKATKQPGPTLITRLRAVLEPGRIPFLGSGSRDVSDAFDQIMADEPTLQDAAATEAPQLKDFARPWRVAPWYSDESLKSAGAIPLDAQALRGESDAFAVDGQGRLHMVVAGTPARIIRLEEGNQLKVLAEAPLDSQGPYVITFSPDKHLYLVHTTANGGIAIQRVEDGKLVPIFQAAPDTLVVSMKAMMRLAASNKGEVYFAAGRKNMILVARPGANSLEVFAGVPRESGHRDGPREQALFHTPYALAVAPDGRLYVADKDNQCIRRVELDGTVITVAGNPGETESRFGRGTYSRIGEPGAIAVAPDGTMFATDVGAKRAMIIRLSPEGSVFFVAGGLEQGDQEGPGYLARFHRPLNLALDDLGRIYLEDIKSMVGEPLSYSLRKISPYTP